MSAPLDSERCTYSQRRIRIAATAVSPHTACTESNCMDSLVWMHYLVHSLRF